VILFQECELSSGAEIIKEIKKNISGIYHFNASNYNDIKLITTTLAKKQNIKKLYIWVNIWG